MDDYSKLNGDFLRGIAAEYFTYDALDADREVTGDFRLNPEHKALLVTPDAKAAAVLIAIIERENGLSVLLTKRADKLRDHSGQIAFPGGKIDAADANAIAAAVRESQEEINLDANEVEVLGQLPDYYTGSGFKISPVIGLIKPQATFSANPDEVDFVFEVPLSFLMDVKNYDLGERVLSGKIRTFFEIRYEQYLVWGITAGIIRLMRDKLHLTNFIA